MSRSTLPEAEWLVLRNHEGRQSVAPASHPVPAGWEPGGFRGPRPACLAHIAATWTDMRTEALKAAMA
ncbi:MbtH family protein [Amaricoccus solimangrovi]|uniref:MbtH family protein n=1 Tax=Amaricoccus solimangrovi TaxID=2589815 RepID=A0A501WUN8_9RHOB|nr:MbtH family NRPS accessory protein [Amaricoccus solimangrovi]TPE49576.1 MbtH family protein [Amaricoccus solimangrovi]